MGYKKTDKCIKNAYDDERLFVLMARDPAAPKVILHWIAKSLETQPSDKLREAFACAMEMQERGQEFRDRRDKEKKNEADLKQREEFEAWKKRKERATLIRDAERGPDVISHEEAIGILNYEPAVRDFSTLQAFATWLDAQGVCVKIEEAHRTDHGFAKLAEEFFKSLATPGNDAHRNFDYE